MCYPFCKNNIFYNDNRQINLERISLIGSHQYINVSCALMACIKVKELNIDCKSLYKILIQLIEASGPLKKNIKKKYRVFGCSGRYAFNFKENYKLSLLCYRE